MNKKSFKSSFALLFFAALVLVGGFTSSIPKTHATSVITVNTAKITGPNQITIVFNSTLNLTAAPITAYGEANNGVGAVTLASGGGTRDLVSLDGFVSGAGKTAIYTFGGAPATTNATGTLFAANNPTAITDGTDTFNAATSPILLTDGQIPVFTNTAPASNASISDIMSGSSDAGYTLNKNIASGTIAVTRTGGNSDPSSPHICNFTGTALNSGAHVNFAMGDTVNGCLAGMTGLSSGITYQFEFNATDTAGNIAATVTNTNITLGGGSTSTSASLMSVANQMINSTTGDGSTTSPKLSSISVGFSKSTLSSNNEGPGGGDIQPDMYATAYLYSDSAFTAEIASSSSLSLATSSPTVAYIKVVAQDASTTMYYAVTISRATTVSTDAGLMSVANQIIATTTGDGLLTSTPALASISVGYSKMMLSTGGGMGGGDIMPSSMYATTFLYSDSAFSSEIASSSSLTLNAGATTTAYIKVIAEDTSTTLYYAVSIFREGSVSTDAGLMSVANQIIATTTGDGLLTSTPALASISVGYSQATLNSNQEEGPGSGDIQSANYANAQLYSDSDFLISSSTLALTAGATTTAYIKVVAENGTTTLYYAVTVSRAATVSTDATLNDIAGQSINVTSGNGVATTTPSLASINVSYSQETVTATGENGNIMSTSQYANTHLYSNSAFTTEIISPAGLSLSTSSPTVAYIKVVAENGTTTLYYAVTVSRAATVSTDATLNDIAGQSINVTSGNGVATTTPSLASINVSYSQETVTATGENGNIMSTSQYANTHLYSDSAFSSEIASSSSLSLSTSSPTVAYIKVIAEDASTTLYYAVTIHREAAVSSDASLMSVDGQMIPISGGGSSTSTPKLSSISVGFSKSTLSSNMEGPGGGDIQPAMYATVHLYSDSTFITEIASSSSLTIAAGATTTAYIKVVAEDASTTLYYAVSIFRGASVSTDASLMSVANQMIATTTGDGLSTSTPTLASINVGYSKSSLSVGFGGGGDIMPSMFATSSLYSDSDFLISSSSLSLTAGATTTAYIKVVAEDASTTLYYKVDIFRAASLSTDAGLINVAGQSIATTTGNGLSTSTPSLASISVGYSKSTLSVGFSGGGDIQPAMYATVHLYSDPAFSAEIMDSSSLSLTAGATTTAYIKVVAEDTTTTLYYAVSIFREGSALSIIDITPASGPASGGTIITITGIGFVGDAHVTINGAEATSTVASSTQITATTPGGPVGAQIVSITSYNGSATSTFTYSGLPTMTGTVEITGVAKYGQTLTASSTLVNAGTPTYQWNRSGSPIGGATSATYTLVQADITSTTTVTVTAQVGVGTGFITSAPTGVVSKADGPVAPSAPTLSSKTSTNITLTANTANEFSLNGSTWQDSNSFNGLTPATGYQFVARVRTTATSSASVASASSSVFTTDEDPDVVAANVTIGLITNLPVIGDLATTSASAVNTASSSYDVLTSNQKSLVSNYATLQADQAQMTKLDATEIAVLSAEGTPTQGNVDTASSTAATLADGTAKGLYQSRIVAVQTTVDDNTNAVVADKATLVVNLIRDANPDLSNITAHLTNPLPSVGTASSSNITWTSASTTLVSNNGQIINRPAYGQPNATTTLTATITKGAISDTKVFVLTVLTALNPAKAITGFAITGQVGITGINESTHTITVVMSTSTGIDALAPTITTTGSSTNPISGASHDFTATSTYTVTAADGSTQAYTVTVQVLSATQTTPDAEGNATVSTTTPQVIITSPTAPVSLAINSGVTNPTIDLSSLVSASVVGGINVIQGTLPEINIASANAGNVTVAIPATTVVTGPADWDGVIAAPVITTNVTLPTTSGQTKTLSFAIELGSADAELSFSKAIRLLLPGQADKRVGYVRAGTNFAEITTGCNSINDQDIIDAQLVGSVVDCKINTGSDLVVWTKHFTSFAAYTQATTQTTTQTTNGGGGGPSTNYCTSVIYDEWQASCVGNVQYRNIQSKLPLNCTLTTEQNNARQRACGLPEKVVEPNTVVEITDKAALADKQLAEKIAAIVADAAEIFKADINSLLGKLGFKRDLAKEQVSVKKYVKALIKNVTGVTDNNLAALINFITYGSNTTLGLGEGERAGVVNSFKSTYGNLPKNEAEWADVIKIANGRWPNARNASAEAKAAVEFKKVYLRSPDRKNPNDDAAVTIIAYGLRPAQRNLNSEKAAIKTFKFVYGHAPVSTLAWDIVRAIAYSGSSR